MDGMQALVVEDEAKAATFLSNGLSENGWSVDIANDGKIAWGFLREKQYDIVLLDVLASRARWLEHYSSDAGQRDSDAGHFSDRPR